MASFSEIPARVLYIAQNDLKERYKKRTDRIRRYCDSMKRVGSITHLQTEVDDWPDGTVRIKLVEVYPPDYESLMKAKQLFIEAFCEAKYRTKYGDIQAEDNHPLSERALKVHDLQTSSAFHQFRCPKCFKWWWKEVSKHKPVSKCYHCWLCLNPLKPLEQFGIGRFVCPCSNVFFCRCQASDSRKCDICGCRVSKPYIRPYFRTDDARHIPVTPGQQYSYYATTNHGYYHCSFPHPGPTVDATFYDMPQPRRRNTFGDFVLPQIFNSQQFAARNPPRPANPATMYPPPASHATRGFPPMYATSLQSSNINIRPALCAPNNHTAALAIQPPPAISHPSPYSPQVDPRLPQSPASASSTPACSTTSEQTTMAVSLRSVPPILDYAPLMNQVIPSSGVNPQSVNECSRSPQLQTTTSVALSIASGSASVLGEATAIPSSPISLPPITENSNPQPPSTTPSTSGPLPVFPTAISSDPDPLGSDHSFHTQPQLNSSSASEKFPTPLADALADLHMSDTPCAQLPETGSTPIQSQDLLQSDGPPMAVSISPAPPGSTVINPPLSSTSAATMRSTPPESDASTGSLVKASGHVSFEEPPPDHYSGNVDYNPSVTTAIPPSYDPMTLSESQGDSTAPNHHDLSQTGSGTDNVMSLAAATKSDLSLPETSAPPTISAAKSSNTVMTSTASVDANTQTEVKMSMLGSSLDPSQGLPTSTAPLVSSSIPGPPGETATMSAPQAIATRFESKEVQTATLHPINVVNNITVAIGNPAQVGSMAKPARNPHPAQNDQWTSYYDNRVRIHKNPRDLKYKQVSTLHDCSGSTEYSTDFSAVPQHPHWKHHQMRHPANGNQYYDLDGFVMDYDMLEISSDEED